MQEPAFFSLGLQGGFASLRWGDAAEPTDNGFIETLATAMGISCFFNQF
jgi:hypothetical protein